MCVEHMHLMMYPVCVEHRHLMIYPVTVIIRGTLCCCCCCCCYFHTIILMDFSYLTAEVCPYMFISAEFDLLWAKSCQVLSSFEEALLFLIDTHWILLTDHSTLYHSVFHFHKPLFMFHCLPNWKSCRCISHCVHIQ